MHAYPEDAQDATLIIRPNGNEHSESSPLMHSLEIMNAPLPRTMKNELRRISRDEIQLVEDRFLQPDIECPKGVRRFNV
jgi:hypothetical protein